MTSRERVRRALRHQRPDRVPTFFRAHLPDGVGFSEAQLESIDEWVDIGLGADAYLRLDDPEWSAPTADGIRHDELGVGRRYTGLYWDIVEFPLADLDDPAQLGDYPWPELRPGSRTSRLRARALATHERGNAVAVMGSWGGSTSFFELSWYMRGFEAFLMDLHLNVPLAEALLDKQLELHQRRWELILDEVGDLADIVCTGDDLGTQTQPPDLPGDLPVAAEAAPERADPVPQRAYRRQRLLP